MNFDLENDVMNVATELFSLVMAAASQMYSPWQNSLSSDTRARSTARGGVPSLWPRGLWPIGPAIAQRSRMMRDLMVLAHGVEATCKPNKNYRAAAQCNDGDHREGEWKMPI